MGIRAARAGTDTAFPSGDITAQAHTTVCAEDAALAQIGWYCHNAGGRPHAVAGKSPNALGLHDMAGNIFEWCNDLYDGRGYGAGPLSDPTGSLTPGADLMPALDEVEGDNYPRVLRGGNHVTWASMAKSSSRFDAIQYSADSGVGLRLVRSLPPAIPVP